MAFARAYEPLVDYSTFPVFTLPLVMLVLWTFSLVREPLENAISRHFERQCDRYALDRTGLNFAFITAFRKLARLNKDDPNPHPLEVFLFHSHPSINQRLAMAERS
jgi:STE24 endopeptidase